MAIRAADVVREPRARGHAEIQKNRCRSTVYVRLSVAAILVTSSVWGDAPQMSSLTPFEVLRGVEPKEAPLRVFIKIRRDVTHFSGLAQVSEGFQSLDGLLRTEFEIKGASVLKGSLLEARSALHRFRVNSDPVAEVVANYPWLSVLVVAVIVVRDYQRFRDSSRAMLDDAGEYVNGMRGLTQTQKERVMAGVQLLVEELLKQTEESLRAWAEKLNRVRRAITGTNDEKPSVSTTDPDA